MKERRNWKKAWRLWRLGAVERYYFELKESNTFPFEDLGDGIYYIQIRSDKFVFGLGTICVAIISFTGFSILIGYFSFPLVLFLSIIGYGVICVYGNTSTKELIISRHGGYLLRIKGNHKILVEEPINNVYIKLNRKYDTNQLAHFYLILGGYRLDDIRLTGITTSDSALRILGSGVAVRMGINFFDVDNSSAMHQIVHFPGHSLLTPPEDEFARFLKLHGITQKEIEIGRLNENIPEDSDKAPLVLLERIRSNYGIGLRNSAAINKNIEKSYVAIPFARDTLQSLLELDKQKQKLQEKSRKQ